ncbi:hypothetical protein [Chitinophaga caseinilytica]|uniref:ZU5 domain-containing protein n=1 Tax=Chitinophaga caseinilytica TaxID=2267521 RepID=A0ABZ2Z0B3_9BACT
MIRKMKRSFFFVLLLAAVVSCKKNNGDEGIPQKLPEPKVEEHGTPQGTPVVKSIGPAGGSIQSADGNIAVDIPAGAVSAATNFSIQTVTPTLEAATGPSYRLLPENVQFQKDVKITLRYTDSNLIGTNEDDLYLAYQDAQGYWNREIMTGIDKANKKLTAQTRHFSDWTIERVFRVEIASSDRVLEANEQAMLLVQYQDVKKGTNQIIQGVWVPDKNIETWFATGPGTFDNTKHHKVNYKAPASIPKTEEIAVGVRIRNLVNRRNPDRPGNTGLVIVQVPITLLPAEYFVWEVDGTMYFANSTDGTRVGNNITLIGTGLLGGLNITANAEKGEGKYVTGSLQEDKKIHVQLGFPQGTYTIYQSTIFNCNGKVMYGAGSMNIEKFGRIGEAITGTVTATVYVPGSGCNLRSKKVTGKFRIIRKL